MQLKKSVETFLGVERAFMILHGSDHLIRKDAVYMNKRELTDIVKVGNGDSICYLRELNTI